MSLIKKSLLTTILVLILLCGSNVFGQDITRLLEAVDQIETNLKALIEKEAAARNADITRLETKLEEKSHSSAPVDNQAFANLEKKINKLQQMLASAPTGNTGLSDSEAATLVSDIEFLKSEITYMKNLVTKNSQQLASNQSTVAVRSNNDEIAILTSNLATVAESLSELAQYQGVSESSGLEISGFFDVVNSYDRTDGDNTNYSLGQAEIDLAHELADNVAVEIAVAYIPEDGVFEVGAAIIDIHLFSSDGDRHVRSSFIDHSSVIIGQFDVPFGLDYFDYASVDRKLITAPLAVDFTHGQWNDFGVQFVMDSKYGNFVAYAVNGFDASANVLDQIATLAAGVDVYEEVNTSPANAFGTRVGFTPLSMLEVGTSFAVGMNQSDKGEMTLWGADFQLDFDKLYFKGEYINHSLNRTVAEENNKGYYFQGLYSFSKFFVTSRYGSFQPDGAEWIGQMSVGAGYSILDNVEVRMESVFNEDTNENITMFQMVTGF